MPRTESAAQSASAALRAGPAVTTPSGIAVFGCEPDEAVLFRELAHRHGIAVTITDDHPAEATVAVATGNRCVSVSHKARISHPTLVAMRETGVRYISTRSIGYDHIDVDFAAGLGIVVGNSTYSPDGVADYTIMLILMAIRDAGAAVTRASRHDYRLSGARGRTLRDLTVGVVGTGRIGSAVVDRLRGFGGRVLTCDRRLVSATAGTEQVPLNELLRRSDVVTLHTPLTSETHHLLDARRIALMRPGAVVVNTGRGPLVDTEALVAALEDGRLAGAALDVVEGEEALFYADHGPSPATNPVLRRLQELPNALITPHTAYYTDRVLRETVESSFGNCLTFEGDPNDQDPDRHHLRWALRGAPRLREVRT